MSHPLGLARVSYRSNGGCSSSSVVPEQWRLLYSFNPMVGVIDGFRWCILGGQSPPYLPGLAAGVFVAVFFLWFGIQRFRNMEKSFADLI
jgi:lipopolysaccharide transport system permease protein